MAKLWMFGAALAALLTAGAARADDNTVTIGIILPMTGQQASTGKQERAGAQLYIQQHGDTVAGKKIVLEVKDDTGAADVTKRLAEELIGNDHAKVLMGFGLTPLALATAPVATEAKVPEIVSAALYRPHLVHASPSLGADGRMGRQEPHQEGRYNCRRLRTRNRR
jgi:branched-chain amino acid transport system substrate-binding protein